MKSFLCATVITLAILFMEAENGQCFILNTDRNRAELLDGVNRVEKMLSKIQFLEQFLRHINNGKMEYEGEQNREILTPFDEVQDRDDSDEKTERKDFSSRNLLDFPFLTDSIQKRQGVAPIWKEMCLAAGFKC